MLMKQLRKKEGRSILEEEPEVSFFSVPQCKFHFPQRGGWKLPRTVPGGMRASGEVHMGARDVNNYEAMGLPPGSGPVVC